MQLVILAAGHARRFGGLKQLAPVGPNGETIMDYTARDAEACGFDRIVLVVRDEIRNEIEAHVKKRWPGSLGVEFVHQHGVAGTAQAVVSASPLLEGPFGVANADDLYGERALLLLRDHFARDAQSGHGGEHLLIGYELVRTVLTSGELTRGLIEVDDDDRLVAIAEHTVKLRGDGRFEARELAPAGEATVALPKLLSGRELVSMNLWGFHERMLDHLTAALSRFDPDTEGQTELLLPDVVGELVATRRDVVHVVSTTERCIGITHHEDLDIVRDEIASSLAFVRSSPRD